MRGGIVLPRLHQQIKQGMKKELLFALVMAATLHVSVEEITDAQAAFVDDYKQENSVNK